MGKLLFFDIDGTLVNFEGKMPDSTVKALHKARENGHKIFLNTGRSYKQIYDFLLDFGFDGIVAAAGGYIEYNGEMIFNRVFGEDLVKKVIEVIKDAKAATILQTKGSCASCQEWADTFVRIFNESYDGEGLQDNPTFSETIIDEDTDTYHERYADTESFIYVDSKYTIDEMREMFSDEIQLTPSSFKEPEPYSGEITLSDINKAIGIQKVMEALGVSREDTIAFGDGANDIDMVKYAGIGVAMGNSQDCLFEVADVVAGDINDDGLYHVMEELELI